MLSLPDSSPAGSEDFVFLLGSVARAHPRFSIFAARVLLLASRRRPWIFPLLVAVSAATEVPARGGAWPVLQLYVFPCSRVQAAGQYRSGHAARGRSRFDFFLLGFGWVVSYVVPDLMKLMHEVYRYCSLAVRSKSQTFQILVVLFWWVCVTHIKCLVKYVWDLELFIGSILVVIVLHVTLFISSVSFTIILSWLTRFWGSIVFSIPIQSWPR
jgi:hypothetical protein